MRDLAGLMRWNERRNKTGKWMGKMDLRSKVKGYHQIFHQTFVWRNQNAWPLTLIHKMAQIMSQPMLSYIWLNLLTLTDMDRTSYCFDHTMLLILNFSHLYTLYKLRCLIKLGGGLGYVEHINEKKSIVILTGFKSMFLYSFKTTSGLLQQFCWPHWVVINWCWLF